MHIVYVGYPGFPTGHAQVERQKLIAKGVMNCGCNVTVISRYGILDEEEQNFSSGTGKFEGIRYIFASGIPYRPSSFLKRNLYKVQGLLKELYLILKYRYSGNLDAVLITTNSFYNVILYSILAYICRVPCVLDNVEYCSSIKVDSVWLKIDYKLYDKFAYKLVTKVICISDFLYKIVKEGSPNKSVLKIPTIVDYSKFNQSSHSQEAYFLFCGSAVYFEIIDFIIEAYEKLNQDCYKLYLVSNGNFVQMQCIRERIARSPLQDSIRLYSGLSYTRLVQLYMGSKALLIPLLDREQDKARFPHKIGEYCAAGKVIISTKVGEMTNYFQDQESALLADNPDPVSFSSKMQFVMDHPERAEELGRNSYFIGKLSFNNSQLGEKIFQFLTEKENCPTSVTHRV